ncbi:spermatogenesis-associated protein 4 isoform X2 [Corythoichthys intestinalis]|uniref:spermatogenesis-associated protein 4 isoform X2 n=1 Tax=Corythoichthys intestinalis TaxID=161448 RepID=UPI0025A4D25E|nr:spermatogenesis-associated protein 4 isoform X2 [Corythoichthys intestinalis]
MTGLPRDVTRWLQSLELTVQSLNVRRDFQMHAYSRGASFSAKQDNWNKILRTVQKLHLQLTEKLVYGTIHCKPGAAEMLVQQVYTILTKHRPRTAQNPELDFSDQKYQQLLPPAARSTASTAVKSNLRKTEVMAVSDLIANGRRAEAIICKHLQDKELTDRERSNKSIKRMTGNELSPDGKLSSVLCLQPPLSVANLSYKTIKVNQPARRLPPSC